MYAWDEGSTYVQEPPFFVGLSAEVPPLTDVVGARCLVKVGDSITTDHISPAGSIKAVSPAGEYLQSKGVQPGDFNSYGSRRGNHEVMLRGTFANVRLRNELAPDTEGPWTTHVPGDEPPLREQVKELVALLVVEVGRLRQPRRPPGLTDEQLKKLHHYEYVGPPLQRSDPLPLIR